MRNNRELEHKLNETWVILTILGSLGLLGSVSVQPDTVLRMVLGVLGAVVLFVGGILLGVEVGVHHYHHKSWKLDSEDDD